MTETSKTLKDYAKTTVAAADRAAVAWGNYAHTVRHLDEAETAYRKNPHWAALFESWTDTAETTELAAWEATNTAAGNALNLHERCTLEKFRLNSAQAAAAQTCQALARLLLDLSATYPSESYEQAKQETRSYDRLLQALKEAATVLTYPY